MKRYIFLFATLLFTVQASSQYKVEVETGEKNMSKGTHLAFTVLIPESRSKDIEPVWKKYVNNRSLGERISNFGTGIGNAFRSEENKVDRDRLRVETKGGEMYVRSVEVNKISKYALDVYARITELPEGCRFSAFFQFTDSAFINNENVDAEKIESLSNYIRDFGIEAYKSVVDDQIKDAKKVVSKEEGILKKIERGSKKAGRSISGYESDIQKFNATIFEVESDIVRMNDIINMKKDTFPTYAKETPEYEAAKKELKTLEKEKSGYFKEIKSLKKKIKSKEQAIKSAQNKIAENELKVVRQQQVIAEKERIVEQLNQKKDGIN